MRNLIFIIGLCFVYSACKQSNNRPKVPFPQDNPSNQYKVELGEKLFFDKRLSGNNTVACASCHQPKKAFTDNLTVAVGVDGKHTKRNTPSIINAAYLSKVMFDGELNSLELQTVVPLQEHTEMDMSLKEIVPKLKAISTYNELSKKAFGHDFDAWSLTRSLADYVRTLVCWNSRFDTFYFDKKNSLTKEELAGYQLFSEKLYCAKCHPAPYFTIFQTASNGLIDELDGGRYEITANKSDWGKFKIPSLKNVALTFPYMHNGSLKTLDDVIEYYEKGGDKTVNQSKIIQSFTITLTEKKQLKAFLNSLTDSILWETKN